MASDNKKCYLNLLKVAINNTKSNDYCAITMLIDGLEHLESGLEPCCAYCRYYQDIIYPTDQWCTLIWSLGIR